MSNYITKAKILKALSVGEVVYVKHRGNVGRTVVTEICDDGIDTKYDYLPYDEHGERWWLTKFVAMNACKKGASHDAPTQK